jgi:hypothetical protein
MLRRALVALLLVTMGLVAATVPAQAKKSTACAYLTKKQVSTILRHKVVDTATESDKATGAQQCEYRTSYYQQPRFKDLDAPYKLQITTQPLLDDVQKTLDTLQADPDAEDVPGLGDRAFYNDGDDLIVVVGPIVLLAEVTNVQWSGAELDTLKRGPERAAMDLLVPLFE